MTDLSATVEFKVVAVSANTNSFGLRQLILVSKEGHTYKACFSYLNVKEKGESIKGRVYFGNNGQPSTVTFPGGELVEKGDKAPREVIKAIFK